MCIFPGFPGYSFINRSQKENKHQGGWARSNSNKNVTNLEEAFKLNEGTAQVKIWTMNIFLCIN